MFLTGVDKYLSCYSKENPGPWKSRDALIQSHSSQLHLSAISVSLSCSLEIQGNCNVFMSVIKLPFLTDRKPNIVRMCLSACLVTRAYWVTGSTIKVAMTGPEKDLKQTLKVTTRVAGTSINTLVLLNGSHQYCQLHYRRRPSAPCSSEERV